MMKLTRMLKMAKMKRPWSKSWKPQQQLDIKHILGPVLDQIDQLWMMNQIFWSKRRAPILLVKISALWATMASKIHKCWDTTTDTTDQAGKKAMSTSLCKEGGCDIYNTWAYLIVYHQRQTQKQIISLHRIYKSFSATPAVGQTTLNCANQVVAKRARVKNRRHRQ